MYNIFKNDTRFPGSIQTTDAATSPEEEREAPVQPHGLSLLIFDTKSYLAKASLQKSEKYDKESNI